MTKNAAQTIFCPKNFLDFRNAFGTILSILQRSVEARTHSVPGFLLRASQETSASKVLTQQRKPCNFVRSKCQPPGLEDYAVVPAIPLLLLWFSCLRPWSFYGESAFYGHFSHAGLYSPVTTGRASKK
jgi:hypothetical protein